MKTRARIAVPLVVGLVVPVLMVTLTGPAQSSAPLNRSSARVTPHGVLTLSAPIVQPGRKPASSTRAKVSGTVRFKPRRKKRPVIVQRRVEGGAWRKAARKRQNRKGMVSFTGLATTRSGEAYSYRAITPRWKRNRKVVTDEQTTAAWGEAFTDEFSGTSLSPQWADRPAPSTTRKCSTVGDPRARGIGGGTLKLRVRRDPDHRGWCRIRSGPDKGRYHHYLNGQVGTSHLGALGSFTYGTFAARIKFPKRRGQHGSFWMQPAKGGSNVDDDPALSGAEIDVAEHFGKGYPKGGLASFLYNYGVVDKHGNPVKIGGMAPRATRALPRRDTWWKHYHVFSIEWTPRYYSFMVDGRQHFRTKRGVSGVSEYLILSLLSSDWELKQAKRHHINPGGTMLVDWAGVWQKE